MAHQAPIVTPEFATRIRLLSFAGNDTENVSEGMWLVAWVIVYHRSQQTCASIQSGQYEVANYDLVGPLLSLSNML
jgi:hypothetical protein